MTIKGKAYIVGAYEHPLRKAPKHSVAQLHAEVAKGAIEDAGLRKEDIDAYFCAGDAPGANAWSMANYLNLNKLRHIDSTDMGGCSYLMHVGHAAQAIAAPSSRCAPNSSCQSAPAKRAAPCTPSLPENRSATNCCPAPSTCQPITAPRRRLLCAEAVRLTQAIIKGGVVDKAFAEVSVRPEAVPSAPIKVITDTWPTKLRNAVRKASGWGAATASRAGCDIGKIPYI
jgi:hypothetical protein